jgi:hypothetical protein
MIVEIALGILLALAILYSLPLVIAGGLILAGIAVALGVLALLVYWIANDLESFLITVMTISCITVAIICGVMLTKFLAKRTRLTEDEARSILVLLPFLCLAGYTIGEEFAQWGNVHALLHNLAWFLPLLVIIGAIYWIRIALRQRAARGRTSTSPSPLVEIYGHPAADGGVKTTSREP